MTTRTKRVLSSAARARRSKVQSEPISPAGTTGPRTGAKRTLVGTMKEIPNFLRLLYGLVTDPRVSNVDKLLVAGAIAYVLMPMDIIPDFIPFIGEVDDVFVIVMALQRLISNAGRAVVADHWMGEPGELSALNLERVLAACAFFLPRRIRRRLRTIGRDI
ncbi:MAG: YkvA family protein [Gemmatimonadota bacterium]|nr:YkvA family protein [Gemmatimonadota bacterium]